MLPLAHLAAGYLAGRLWNRLFPRRPLNSLLAMLGGLLPDLLDKPLNLAIHDWDSTRSLGHTLGFLVLLVLLGKGYPFCKPLALGVATHLALDNPLTYTQTLLWPVRGPQFQPGPDLTWEAFLRHLQNPVVGSGEIVGGAILLVVAARHALLALGWIRDPGGKHRETAERSQRFVEEVRSRREAASGDEAPHDPVPGPPDPP